MEQTSGLSEPIRPDRDLLTRICGSREFLDANVPKKILKVLFNNALSAHPQKLSTSLIIERYDKRDLSAAHVRKEITGLRKKLESYFQQHDEKISFSIEPETYLLTFKRHETRFVQAGSMLDLFWRPYLSPDWKVRFIVGDLPHFCDFLPKRHWAESHFQVPIRGDCEVIRGDEYTYLPTGLLRAVTTFDRFFALQDEPIPFEYDISLEAPTLTGSLIVVGNDPFESAFRTWPSDLGWPFIAEDDSKPRHARSRVVPRDGMTKTSPLRFVYHATVERLPIYKSKFFKTIIRAHHSVAVEEAAKFLISEERMGEVVSSLSPEPLTNLHISLRVVCKIKDHPAALKLVPGIPRIYLDVMRTELLQVNDKRVTILTEDGDTDAELDRVKQMIATLNATDADEYTEPNTGITYEKNYGGK